MKKQKIAAPLIGTLLVASFLFHPQTSWAWGYRGHHNICVVATHLVQNTGLRDFLKSRADEMGFLCNIPDVFWRSSDKTHLGDNGHYADLDFFDIDPNKIPQTFDELVQQLKNDPKAKLDKENPEKDAAVRFGTIFWRTDQLYKLAIEKGSPIAKAKAPKTSFEQQNWDLPYNVGVYDMMTTMGVMGHFVGDASMPYHVTRDHDGWEKGHGGIHSYYETDVVDEIDLTLQQKTYEQALKLSKSESGKSVVDRIAALTRISLSEIKMVDEKDKVLAPSVDSKDPAKRIKAKRLPADQNVKVYEDMIEVEMARSAKLLAEFWDEIYISAGSPDLSHYRSYHFPLEPEFIPMDFIKNQKATSKSGKERAHR